MKPKTLYLALCLLGFVLPYAEFFPWLLQHGLNLPLFIRELLSTRIGTFFAIDVLISAGALIAFTRVESRRIGIRNRWLILAAVLTVGVSLALPLFLYLREVELQRHPLPATA